MQKYDWRRLFSEVRPTFLSYARFQVQTCLSPEECRKRLASITQPQKLPVLFPARTSDDPRLIFKGQATKASFLAIPIGHRPIQEQSRITKPFLLSSTVRPALSGTVLTVQVMPDLFAAVVMGALLSLVGWRAAWPWIMPELSVFEPLLLAQFLFFYGALTLPVSFEAYRVKQILERLLA